MATQAFYPFRSEEDKTKYTSMYLNWAKSWPVLSETMLVDTPAGQTFVRISGRVTDPPLVLLPGARGTSLMWAGMIRALSAHYRTYALDTINDTGLSVMRRPISTPDDLVRWLDEVFGVLVPEGRLNVMGMSYGGWLASLYAVRFPDRLAKVIMLAPGSTVLRLSFGFVARAVLLSLPLPGLGGNPLRRTIRWIFKDTLQSGEAGRKVVEEDLPELLSSGRHFAIPRMMWPTVLDDQTWREFRVPALFIVGENEKIYSPKTAVKRLNRLAPHIQTEIIPGAGHDLTLAKPDVVARKVLDFLAVPAGGPADAELPRTTHSVE
jgi:pimeloyl-ACP methyl ester carboxylesterase